LDASRGINNVTIAKALSEMAALNISLINTDQLSSILTPNWW